MAVETNIIGFITYYGSDREYNEKILKETDYDIWKFAEMFGIPKESGTKGPHYIFFGAGYGYLEFDEWLNKFENILKKLKAFKAFLFVDKELDREFVIGYNLNNQFKKEEIDLGRDDLYNNGREFPLLFYVIKHLKNKPIKHLKNKPNINNIDEIWNEI